MEIGFLKLQCCGGDYILIDTFKNAQAVGEHLPDLAAQITSRRFGVGAEGLALILPGERLKLRLACYDPAGRLTAADPMAVRCVARYAFDSGLTDGEAFSLETPESSIPVEVLDAHNITVPFGPPAYWEGQTALRERSAETFTRTARLGDRELNFTPVRLGSPYAVFFPIGTPLEVPALCTEIEQAGAFAAGVDLVFARLLSREEISLRAWRVGSGELLASDGTAGAALVAAVLNGFGERQGLVHLESGNLFVEWSESDNLVYASGAAEYVFLGTYYYEEGEPDEE
jgi:diaminopimelate epimerase